MRICLIGLGSVGKGITKVISKKHNNLKKQYELDLKIVAVTDSTGAAISQKGIDPNLILETKNKTGKISDIPNIGIKGLTGLETLDKVEYDLLIDVTPSNIENGEPAKSLTLKAFNDKKNVVTSNKGHLTLYYTELINTAIKNNVQFKFEASVGGAMPIINFATENLSGNKILSIIGILNGTTNFILSRMTAEGSSYEQTLKEAQQLGIAETNPEQDVEGLDAMCKTVIIANSILGIDCTLHDVDVTGISKITPEAIKLAKKEGYFIKLIAEISKDSLNVSPRLVKMDSPYVVDGTLNMATLKTELAEDITVIGQGAGSIETASAILSDILTIWKNQNSIKK